VTPRAGLDAVARRKYPSTCWESNPSRLARSSVTTLAELPRLSKFLYDTFITILFNHNLNRHIPLKLQLSLVTVHRTTMSMQVGLI
jgi:hypothetical protein